MTQATYPDPDDLEEAVVGPCEQELTESSYRAMCDEQDGLEDGILNDSRRCDFDVAMLLCKGERNDGCSSRQQVAAVKVAYDGPVRTRRLCRRRRG